MERRQLGQTDVTLSPIGLGCWQFSQGRGITGGMWAVIDRATIDRIVAASLADGVDWFDTAQVYGNGRSEQTLATALHDLDVRPGAVVVATKWLPILRRASNIARTIDARLSCLQGYPIDLYQVHQPWSLSSIGEQMHEMAALVHDGRVRAVGVSNFSAAQMERASAALQSKGLPLASNQVQISLLDRRIERNGVLEAARRLGVTLIAYSPLAQGLLSGRFHDDPSQTRTLPRVRRLSFSPAGCSYRPENLARTRPLIDELRRVATAHDATPSQIALAWLITHYGDTVVAIPGATRPEQAADNAGAMHIELAHDELTRLDEASKRVARG
jgi:aryl-alcohol dehydrogenase-like predicted oxidoreductase